MSTISLVKGTEPVHERLAKIADQLDKSGVAFTSKLRTGTKDGRIWKVIVSIFSFVGISLETSNAEKTANKLVKYLENKENQNKIFGDAAHKAENVKNFNRLLEKVITQDMRQKEANKYGKLFEKCVSFIPKDEQNQANNSPNDSQTTDPVNAQSQPDQPAPVPPPVPKSEPVQEEKKAEPTLEEKKKEYDDFAKTIEAKTYTKEEIGPVIKHWITQDNLGEKGFEKIALMQRMLATATLDESKETKEEILDPMFLITLKALNEKVYGTEALVLELSKKVTNYTDGFATSLIDTAVENAITSDNRALFEQFKQVPVAEQADPSKTTTVDLLPIAFREFKLHEIWTQIFSKGAVKVASLLAEDKQTQFKTSIQQQGATTALVEGASIPNPHHLNEIITEIAKVDPAVIAQISANKEGKQRSPLCEAAISQNVAFVKAILSLNVADFGIANLEAHLEALKTAVNPEIFNLLLSKAPEGKVKDALTEALKAAPVAQNN